MTNPLANPQGYPPDTVMSKEQLAAALGVSVDTIDRSGLPVSYALGTRTPRYIWRQVIAYLEKAAAA